MCVPSDSDLNKMFTKKKNEREAIKEIRAKLGNLITLRNHV